MSPKSWRQALVRGLVIVTVSGSGTTPAVVHSRAPARPLAALPSITVTVGRTVTVSAPRVREGWAHIEVAGAGRTVVARFADSYDLEAFTVDYETFQEDAGPEGEEALDRVMRGTTFLGSVVLGGTGSIKLPRTGTYTVLTLNTFTGTKAASFSAGPSSPATRTRPSSAGTIRALDGAPWRGPSSLPGRGGLMLENRGSDLHALVLQRVEEGTTAAAYSTWMYSNEAEPNPNLPGRVETTMLSPGRRMLVRYRLPRGQYAVMCFETDPASRMAHVFEGEIRMIHLR